MTNEKSNYDKIKNLIFDQIFEISGCDKTKKKSNCDHAQKLKFWPNQKTQILTDLKNLSCDKTQLKLWLNSSNCNKIRESN